MKPAKLITFLASIPVSFPVLAQEEGIDEFHFYALNRAELTYAICHSLGLRPETSAAGETADV